MYVFIIWKSKRQFSEWFLKFNNVSAGRAWDCWFFSLVNAVTLGSILISFQVHSGSLFNIHEVQQHKKEEKSFL